MPRARVREKRRGAPIASIATPAQILQPAGRGQEEKK
jgi:hypothetical protein